jgi:hypothetical protein
MTEIRKCQICEKEIILRKIVIGTCGKKSFEKNRSKLITSKDGVRICNRWFCNECYDIVLNNIEKEKNKE